MHEFIKSIAVGLLAIGIGIAGVHQLFAGRTTLGGVLVVIALIGVAYLIESQS